VFAVLAMAIGFTSCSGQSVPAPWTLDVYGGVNLSLPPLAGTQVIGLIASASDMTLIAGLALDLPLLSVGSFQISSDVDLPHLNFALGEETLRIRSHLTGDLEVFPISKLRLTVKNDITWGLLAINHLGHLNLLHSLGITDIQQIRVEVETESILLGIKADLSVMSGSLDQLGIAADLTVFNNSWGDSAGHFSLEVESGMSVSLVPNHSWKMWADVSGTWRGVQVSSLTRLEDQAKGIGYQSLKATLVAADVPVSISGISGFLVGDITLTTRLLPTFVADGQFKLGLRANDFDFQASFLSSADASGLRRLNALLLCEGEWRTPRGSLVLAFRAESTLWSRQTPAGTTMRFRLETSSDRTGRTTNDKGFLTQRGFVVGTVTELKYGEAGLSLRIGAHVDFRHGLLDSQLLNLEELKTDEFRSPFASLFVRRVAEAIRRRLPTRVLGSLFLPKEQQ